MGFVLFTSFIQSSVILNFYMVRSTIYTKNINDPIRIKHNNFKL